MEYEGTNYYGFQIQAQRPTVQGALEKVLTGLGGGEPIRIRYAGRTDTGVHALGQVIAFHIRWRHELADLERACNARLPDDIAVRQMELVTDPLFHPRYSARARVYRYSVWTAAVRSPIRCRTAHHEPRALDLARMNEAAALLVGRHDFAAFGQPTHGEGTVRVVYAAQWRSYEDGGVPLVVFDIEANAFLRRMVRTITSTLLEVGKGIRPADNVAGILRAKERALVAQPAPARGLCLLEVKY